MIKSYTDIEQSKKLAEILPLESADMVYIKHSSSDNPDWRFDNDIPPMVLGKISINELTVKALPCWSPAALLSVLTENKICHYDDRYYCQYINEGSEFPVYSTAEYDNPVDACVAMVEKLHEFKVL